VDTANHPPARKVLTRAPSKTVRVLNLAGILDAPIECESSLERDFVYRAVLCPGVAQIRHQPFQLVLASGRRYTPDFLVTHRRGPPTVVEVKPASKIPAYLATFDEVSRRMAERGVAFLVANDKAIRHDGAQERAALILRYRKSRPDPLSIEQVRCALAAHGPVRFERLLQITKAPREVVLHLVATKVLITSSSLSLAERTQVHLVGEHHHEIRTEGWFGLAAWRTHARTGSHPG
jgi:hypothetical protein